MLEKKIVDVISSIEKAESLLFEVAKVWSRQYINSLPNAAFAVVESGYGEGKNKNARHLPHHNESVKSSTENSSVDLPHYRNALVRVNQIRSVLKTESDGALRKKAAAHLEKHRAVLKASLSSFTKAQLIVWEECELLFEKNVKPLLKD